MIPGLCAAFYTKGGKAVGSFSATTDSAFQEAFGEGSITTGQITAIPIGGVSPYTYLWTIDGAATLTHSTSASTEATATVGPDDQQQNAARCVITDSASHSAQTPDVTFAFQWT